MVRFNDIQPLTGFLRDHKTHMKRLAATGRPEVLTVNGRASIVIQDAEAYQKLLEQIDTLESERLLRKRIASVSKGELGIPAKKVLSDVRKRLGIKK
jgi:hypothetical protein